MNSTTRLFRITAFGLLASTMVWAQPAQPRGSGLVNIRDMIDAKAPPATADRFVLHDVVFFTGEPLALITDKSYGRYGAMFFPGDFGPAGCSIKEIAAEHVVLVDRRNGQEVELKVTRPAAPTLGSPEWFRSDANPMRNFLITPPLWFESWAEMSQSQKAELAAFYNHHGWRLARAETIVGILDIVWERVDQVERLADAEAARTAFIRLLTSTQTPLWEQMQTYGNVYATAGSFTPEQERFIAARGKVIAEFKASLTPEQQVAYDRMNEAPARNGITFRTAPEPDFVLSQVLANPTLNRPADWPAQLRVNWPYLSLPERVQIVEHYRKQGWQPLYFETIGGQTDAPAWRNLHEAEQMAARKAKRDAFAASLSKKSRRIWDSGVLNRTVYVANGQPDYAKNRNPPDQQKIFEEFWASLSRKQKAAYADLYDFGQAGSPR